ncbi:hypothetical protein [Streptomyces sp. NPDC050416]|uniref:hypothetical protein n=1 Tax=Streptomyces sp. NPDC050416 TaxID=3365611 RepID=UPI0037AF02DC
MPSNYSHPALRPVVAEPGVLVHPTADRRLAAEHWLLATLPPPGRDRARLEWQQHEVALLPLGTLFSAVRIPGRLLVALTGSTSTSELDEFMCHALDGGPVICDPHHLRYYALVPASMPRTWSQAVDDWRSLDVDCLGHGSYLGVPRADAVEYTRARATYWSVPMHTAATLCRPLKVARLIAAGRHCMPQEPDE